jgi:hypothetical protein
MTQPTLTTPRVYRFDTKFELVENRSVRRSLDFEDEIDDSIVWSIRCVPLGHNAMFYLCRNAFPAYYEFEFDYTIVNGDAAMESDHERRAFVPFDTLCEEFLGPAINIPVHPMKNWFIVQITIRHLTQNHFWYIAPNIRSPAHPDNLRLTVTSDVCSVASTSVPDQVTGLSVSNTSNMHTYAKRLFSMFLDELFVDCDLVCTSTGDKFPVHKSVLSAHSVVFRSMFAHRFTMESQLSKVEIPDYDAEPILVMIQWFYTAQLQPLDEETLRKCLPHKQSELSSTLDDNLLLQVTELANKYALDDLEFLCEQKWAERLSNNNVCDLLCLADVFQLYALRMSCTSLVRDNRAVIVTSDIWKQLEMSHPTLTSQVLESL